jgi:hypothetical protein
LLAAPAFAQVAWAQRSSRTNEQVRILDARMQPLQTTGACCLQDGTCVVVSSGDCVAQGGTYQGDGTGCNANAVVDGGFEAGPFSGNWVEFSTNSGTPICSVASCGRGGGSGPRTGCHWAWFRGVAGFEEGLLEQT